MANLKDIIVNGTSRFIGKVFGPTPSEGDYSKQLATTEYVIDNSANQSISNLTEEGESKINASKCLLTNTIVTDPIAYNAVKNYSQDSFDLSKFTVVGSPTITDDGIALTTSTGNYIKTPVVNFSTASTWKIKGKFKSQSTAVESNILAGDTNQYLAIVFNGASKNIRIALGDGSTWFISNVTGASNLSLNTEYEYEFIYDGTGYLLNLNGSEYISKQTSASKVGNTFVLLGVNRTGAEPFANDKTIDLSQFSITVDGVEVFSGNKTGIDAIKPLDAEEIGDVYVNEHGIVENFNVNNAIKAPISFNPVSTVKIRSLLTWNTGSAQPKDGINVPYVFGPNKWRLEVTSTNIYATNDLDASTNTAFNITIPELQNGNVIEIIETITIGTRTVKVIINETDEYSGSTTFAANQAFSTSELAIGNAAFDGSSEYFWNGAINLNMFIVYIDGKLAYEPCLYIPYTQSKTGSKIVENVYRNRVYELYAQTGKAEYYTLDTENENITLPLGEIYGLITSKADTVNVANKSLEDLTDDGNALINNSKAWITGKLTDDKTTYDAIKKLSVSTFDRSKFTVVGSPTITDDGVASGFSTSNYVTTQQLSISGSFDIRGCFKTGNTLDSSLPFGLLGAANNSSCIRFQPKGATGFYLYYGGSQWINNTTFIFETNTKYNYQVTYDGTNLNFYMGKLGEKLVKHTDDIKDWTPYTITGISYGYIDYKAFGGSIDLKQFSITVDGKEVFSGNRTELDVIKADNFEVVGSPDISDDGALTSAPAGNYIKSSTVNLAGANTWDIEMAIKPKVSTLSNSCALAVNSDAKLVFALSTNLKLSAFYNIGGSNTSFSSSVGLTANTWNKIKLSYNGSAVKMFLLSNNIWEQIGSNTSVNTTFNNFIAIGAGQGSLQIQNDEVEIDLNSYKVHINGNLVYQPCLKIPYTLSKTGSKIVDAAYYDRVVDVYEQYGSAYYYTLDRQNGLSSLPFGDIYGLMMKKDDSPDYFSADTPTEFPFIAWREGYINVTVPANEKLLINGNEVVSAGTSAVQMQLRVGLYDNITFSNTTGATLTFYPCKGVLYTI